MSLTPQELREWDFDNPDRLNQIDAKALCYLEANDTIVRDCMRWYEVGKITKEQAMIATIGALVRRHRESLAQIEKLMNACFGATEKSLKTVSGINEEKIRVEAQLDLFARINKRMPAIPTVDVIMRILFLESLSLAKEIHGHNLEGQKEGVPA